LEKRLTNTLKFLSFCVLGISVLTLSFTLNLKNLFDSKTDRIFPEDHPKFTEIKENNKFFADEANTDLFVVSIKNHQQSDFLSKKTIRAFAELEKNLEKELQINAFSYLDVEFAFEKDNDIQFGKISEAELDSKMQNNILENSVFAPKLIAKDRTYINMYFPASEITISHSEFSAKVAGIVKQSGFESFHPISNQLINSQIQKDLGKETSLMLVVSFMVLLAISALLYKSYYASLFHGLLYALNILSSLAFISSMGWQLNTLSISLPIILIIMQISLGAHLLGKDKNQSYFVILKNNTTPILISLGSTLIGFASLAFSNSPFLQDYSRIMCAGILISSINFFLSMAWTSGYSHKFSPRKYESLQNWVDLQLSFIRQHGFRSLVVSTCLFLLVCLAASYKQLNWKAAPNELLAKNTDSFKSLNHHRQKTKGSRTHYISLSANEDSYWEQSSALNNFAEVLSAWQNSHPIIHSSSSYVDLLKLFDSKASLANSDQKIAEAGFLMGMMGTDTSKYISTSKKSLRIEINTKTANFEEIESAVNNLEANIKKSFPEVKFQWYGKNKAQFEIRRELSESLYLSFLVTASIILGILFLIWRDFKLVLLALLPNLIPISALSLFLAASAWSFDPVLAIVFSIVVGISFDNTVFFINSWKQTRSLEPTKHCILNKNKDTLLSNLSLLACFSVFLTSQSEINLKFGILMLLSIFSAYLADSFVLPSLLWDSEKTEDNATLENNLTELPNQEEQSYEIAV
jgi:predicted RND superfamily exporter protein